MVDGVGAARGAGGDPPRRPQRGIQLGLTTAGARALLGVPAAELAGELLELEDVGPDLADLPERLARG